MQKFLHPFLFFIGIRQNERRKGRRKHERSNRFMSKIFLSRASLTTFFGFCGVWIP